MKKVSIFVIIINRRNLSGIDSLNGICLVPAFVKKTSRICSNLKEPYSGDHLFAVVCKVIINTCKFEIQRISGDWFIICP